MRALLQRTSGASVRIGGEALSSIGAGLVVLLGVGHDDDANTADALAERIAQLRIFRDDEGRTNRSLVDVRGEALVVSQFTLFADTRKGRRPSFVPAAEPRRAAELVERLAVALEAGGVEVGRGVFGAEMAVSLENDGPFTLVLDSKAV